MDRQTAFAFGMIVLAIVGITLAVTNPFDLDLVYADNHESNIEKGKNFDRELISINSENEKPIATFLWTDKPERIIDFIDAKGKPVYVDFLTREDANKIYFESMHSTVVFDKATNVLETYPSGKLVGNPQVERQFTHTIKEAVNGTDVWNDILTDETPTTTTTTNSKGIQIISTKGDFKTIYDIIINGFEWTYEYTNNDNAKTDHKYGFTTVCDGNLCDNITIDNTPVAVGETKGKSEIITQDIKLGNKGLNLKNEQHDYTWALKHPEPNKLVIDFTHSKGKLGIGETLTVDPSLYISTLDPSRAHQSGDVTHSSTEDNYGIHSSGGSSFRTALNFDISSIAVNAVVVSANYTNMSREYFTTNTDCELVRTLTDPLTWGSSDGDAMLSEVATPDSIIDSTSGHCVAGTTPTSFTDDWQASAITDLQSVVTGGSGNYWIAFHSTDGGSNTGNTGMYINSASAFSVVYTVQLEPDPPTSLACTSEPHLYGCSWTANNATATTGYHIAHSPDNSTWYGGNVTTIGNVTSFDYVLFGIAESNYIRVNATNGGYNSTASNTILQTTDDIPDAPSIVATSVSDTAIDVVRTAGASDGGDIVDDYRLRYELNGAGGWVNPVTNSTIVNFYNATGLSAGDILVFQWSDGNDVDWSDWSANATASTYTYTTGTVTHSSSEVVGNVVLVEPTTSITTGIPSPELQTIKAYLNGSLATTETLAVTIPETTSYLFNDTMFIELPLGSPYNLTVISTITNTTGTVDISSTGEIVTREYEPFDQLGDTASLGHYNYTIDSTDPANRNLQVNRPFDNATNSWTLNCKSITGFNDAGLTWYNVSGVGFYKETLSASSGQNMYISCYNPDEILFSTVSYGNLTGVLAGFTGFDDQLGSWFGLPMIFMFVFFIAGLFGGRQSGTSMVVTLAVIAILGGIGLLAIDEALWGIMLVLGALGLFASRVRF